MSGRKFIGFGHSLGDETWTNAAMCRLVDTSDEWIQTRTGIASRTFANKKTNAIMAAEAVEKALATSGFDRNQIDGILVATMTPDTPMPSMAHQVKAKLNIVNDKLLAFDINTACTGFLVAMQVADALLETGQCQTVCVIGSEKMSSLLDFKDRSTCVLFGDGAGAVILTKTTEVQESWIHYSNSMSDPHQTLITDPSDRHVLKMHGQAVFRFAIKAMSDAIEHVCAQAKITPQDLDYIIPHQANVRIIDHVASKMGLDQSKFIVNVMHVGNTSAASIPIALSEAMANHQIKPNSKVCLVGFGGGLSWGATLCHI